MSRAIALRSMVMLLVAAGAVLVGPSSHAAMAGIAVRDSSFAPDTLEVATHDSVIFARDSRLAHSITSDTNAFPEQEFPPNERAVGFRFHTPGTYAYHCKYHGGPGGAGMSGVIVVSDPAPTTSSTTTSTEPPPSSSTSTSSSTTSSTTTTTKPPTTTTTRPPTTTTTEPQTTTTTAPPSTTTTEPAPIITPPFEPPAEGPGPVPPTTSADKKKKGGDKSSTTSTSGKGKAVAAAGADPSTTTTQPPDPAEPDPAVAPVDPVPIPEVEAPAAPPTEPVPDVQTLDDLALGRLTAQEEQLPRRDRSGFMLGAGIGMAVVLLVASGWAWYHRPSRYLPA